MSFSGWFPLTPDSVDDAAPRRPAAVQVRQAIGLVRYPRGQSAMVYYVYAADDAAKALQKVFADELAAPGARGHGALWFRFLEGENAREVLEALYGEFVARFGAPPAFHDAGDEGS